MRSPHQSSDRTVQHVAPEADRREASGRASGSERSERHASPADESSDCDDAPSDRLALARRLLRVAKLLATTLAALVGVARTLGLL
ncbi:hypothetical protein [Halomicrobium urmianum]|uniref:hypothetical protein n=1 Tax=Halomicrobium urmianum TaxID=1586233 RepID=UPI001CD9B464|nr:hypothetical protein [Halomicrobium urmianum]